MRRSFPAAGAPRGTPTRKLVRKSASAKDIRCLSDKVSLERVLGLTASNTNGLTCNPYNGILAYPAGCVIVLFNSRTNSQSHIFNPEKKTLTALAFSSDGKFLASGESGHNPRVRVWELGETISQVAELNGHKFSINCVAFSPNMKYLVSIGDQHDMMVNIWNWRTGSKVACNKIGCKVRSVSFAENGSYFVTVGNRHVKFWYFDTEGDPKSNVPTPVAGRSGILGDLRNNCFCDVACGIGDNSPNTYAVTKSGLLCSFNEKRILDRWVELRSSGANSIEVNEKYLFCGCTDGIVRVFHPTTMHFVSSLPKPHFLGVDVAAGLDASHMVAKDTNVKYPDVVSLALDNDNDKLSCVYNDHSLYVWDIQDVRKVGKACSFLYHSACIWGVETYPVMTKDSHPCLPSGSFLTCSSDDTIRVWNLETGVSMNTIFPRNIYSKELLKIIYTDEDLANIQDVSSIPVTTSSDMKTGVRCLQISPDGQLLAAGDRSGNLRVYDLQFVDEIMKIEAHEAEILCVEFSDPKSGYRLLATSSRDRLIHIFDIDKDFALIQTIDDHASSVTAVRMNFDEGVFQLLSCGADKHIMLHTAQRAEDGKALQFVRENTIAIGKATLYDMDVDPTRKLATTCGQDRNVRVYDIQAAKQTHCYKGAVSEDGTLIKIQLDPSGVYAATSCSDKSVNIYDFEAGECVALMYGHSELVTGLKFTADGTRLISVSGDHCIFVWRLVPSFTQAIVTRLLELGKPILGNPDVSNDPMSALRNTFVIPKMGKEDLQDVKEEEEFTTTDPDFFDKEGILDIGSQFDYRFSVGQLPAWAQKQIKGEPESTDASQGHGFPHPSGRWAQRANDVPVLIPQAMGTTMSDSTHLDLTTEGNHDPVSSKNADPVSSKNANPTAGPFQRGAPYSSHQDPEHRKADSVIYIPSTQDEAETETASFQVTARASLRRKKSCDDTIKKPSAHDQSQNLESCKTEANTANALDLEDEEQDEGDEEEEGEELSESDDFQSDHEPEAEEDEDSLQSPLEQHFEYLAEDMENEADAPDDEQYEVVSSPGRDQKQKKGQSFLSRCRSSISAKFLSRSQKAGKNSHLSEDQRKRIDMLKRSMDQNQNYGVRAANSKEVRRMKRLTAKSEPNLSLGVPPAGRTGRKTNNRRGSGITVDNGSDLRVIKEINIAEDDLNSLDRVRLLRSSSTSSAEREKSASELISLFNQRSSTPKHKLDLPFNDVTKGVKHSRNLQKSSPGVSPVASPTKNKKTWSQWKDDSVVEGIQAGTSKEGAVKRRPKATDDRPKMRSRPKSLVLPLQGSLDELIEAHCSKSNSQAALTGVMKPSKKNMQICADEEKPRKDVPGAAGGKATPGKAAPGKAAPGKAAVIVRPIEIEVDDSLESSARKTSLNETVIFNTGAIVDVVSEKTSKQPADDPFAIGASNAEENPKCADESALAHHSSLCSEVLFPTKDSEERIAASTHVLPGLLEPKTPVEKEAKMEVVSADAEALLMAECQAAASRLVASFDAISGFQEKVFQNGDAKNRDAIRTMLLHTYSAVASGLAQQQQTLARAPDTVNEVDVELRAQRVASSIAKVEQNPNATADKTKQVVCLLQQYSDAIVSLVELKLASKS